MYTYIYSDIYIYDMVLPPRSNSSSWGWVHYAIQLNSQYDHMFKNTANTPFYGSYHLTCGSFGFYINIYIYMVTPPPRTHLRVANQGNEEVCIHRTYCVRRRPTHTQENQENQGPCPKSRKSRKPPRPWFQILSSYKWSLSKRMMLQSPSSNITSLQTKPSPLTSSPSHVVEGSTSDTSH